VAKKKKSKSKDKEKDELTEADVDSVFGNLEKLIELNGNFYLTLKERLRFSSLSLSLSLSFSSLSLFFQIDICFSLLFLISHSPGHGRRTRPLVIVSSLLSKAVLLRKRNLKKNNLVAFLSLIVSSSSLVILFYVTVSLSIILFFLTKLSLSSCREEAIKGAREECDVTDECCPRRLGR
jgi:hypothetical protein